MIKTPRTIPIHASTMPGNMTISLITQPLIFINWNGQKTGISWPYCKTRPICRSDRSWQNYRPNPVPVRIWAVCACFGRMYPGAVWLPFLYLWVIWRVCAGLAKWYGGRLENGCAQALRGSNPLPGAGINLRFPSFTSTGRWILAKYYLISQNINDIRSMITPGE